MVLRSQALLMYKDKKMAMEHPYVLEELPMHLSESSVEVASDYTKRKNVFRVKAAGEESSSATTTPTQTQAGAGTEFLFQAEAEDSMLDWVSAIDNAAAALKVFVVDGAAASTPAASAVTVQSVETTRAAGLKKLTSFRHRSPSAHSSAHPSPAAKARKASADQGLSAATASSSTGTSKDKKTWKGKVAKQWKKMHASSSSHSSGGVSAYRVGGAVGVPLEDCPTHDDFPSVPWLVVTCCSIVEEKGLEIVGVYRVPGNSAAVSNLAEQAS